MKKAWLLPIAMISAACSGPVESGPTGDVSAPSQSEAAAAPTGLTHVYTYKTAEREIEFLIADNGTVGTIEKASMDAVEGPLTAPMGSTAAPTLAELFQQVAPGQAVPQELFEGDTQALKLREKASSLATPLALHGELPADPQLEVQASREVKDATCSTDYYNDLWGAQWWIDNYCHWNFSTFSNHKCSYNQTSSASFTSPGTYDSLPAEIFGGVFNGDFNVQGTFIAKWFGSSGAWTDYATGYLAPRNVWWVHWYGLVWYVSTSNVCPHNGATMNTRF